MMIMSGYKIVNKEHTQVYDNVLYLGKCDGIENYDAITIEEAEELMRIQTENPEENLEDDLR